MLWIIFIIVMGVGLIIYFGGPAAFPGIESVTPSVDSEMRFFAAFWMGYGIFTLWIARDLATRHQFVPAIILFLVFGAVGRVISFVVAGRPADSLVNGLIIEAINVVLTTFFYVRYRQG